MLIPRLVAVWFLVSIPGNACTIYIRLAVSVCHGFLVKKHGEPWPKNNIIVVCESTCRNYGSQLEKYFSHVHTHTSESRHSSLYKCTLRSSPDKRNTVSHLPSTRILWQGNLKMMGKTTQAVKLRNSLRVCELEWDEFQVQWLPILWKEEEQYSQQQ